MNHLLKLTTLTLVASSLAIAPTIQAQSKKSKRAQIQRRQQTQSEWQKFAYGSGAVGLLGVLGRNNTLTFLGAAGALYSAYRMEEDRKSTDRARRQLAELYGRRYVMRNGKRYERRTVWKNGKKYYTFVRA
jgi:hypothetical protein